MFRPELPAGPLSGTSFFVGKPRRLIEDLIVPTVILGLLSGWLSAVLPILYSVTFADADGNMVLQVQKPSLYYVAHGVAIATALGAGLLAAMCGRGKMIGISGRFAMGMLFLTALSWAIYAYSADEIFSRAVFGATGPFVWLLLLMVLAGTNLKVWEATDHVQRLLAYATAVLAFRELFTSHFVRYQGYTRYTGYTLLLMWLAGWTLLTSTRTRGLRLFLRFLPFVALVLTSVCSLSRSWTLLSCLLFGTFLVLRAREQGSPARALRTLFAICILVILCSALVLALLPGTVEGGVEAFKARLLEDTRTSQYRAFFRVVPLSSLLIGTGPRGTWYWQGMGDFQYFDNGYLWMLFIGGVPTLAAYFLIVIRPAFHLVRDLPACADGAAVVLILFWALALTGVSTFALPGTSVISMMVCLWAGRCHALVRERRMMRLRESTSRAVSNSTRTTSPYIWATPNRSGPSLIGDLRRSQTMTPTRHS